MSKDKNKFSIERLEMSGRGKRVLWCIKSGDERMFKTETGSFISWEYKKHAQRIIELIIKDGLDSVTKRLDYKWAK